MLLVLLKDDGTEVQRMALPSDKAFATKKARQDLTGFFAQCVETYWEQGEFDRPDEPDDKEVLVDG